MIKFWADLSLGCRADVIEMYWLQVAAAQRYPMVTKVPASKQAS
jgi:hypothetical protein